MKLNDDQLMINRRGRENFNEDLYVPLRNDFSFMQLDDDAEIAPRSYRKITETDMELQNDFCNISVIWNANVGPFRCCTGPPGRHKLTSIRTYGVERNLALAGARASFSPTGALSTTLSSLMPTSRACRANNADFYNFVAC